MKVFIDLSIRKVIQQTVKVDGLVFVDTLSEADCVITDMLEEIKKLPQNNDKCFVQVLPHVGLKELIVAFDSLKG